MLLDSGHIGKEQNYAGDLQAKIAMRQTFIGSEEDANILQHLILCPSDVFE